MKLCYKCHKNPGINAALCAECLRIAQEKNKMVYPVGGESCNQSYENMLFEYFRFGGGVRVRGLYSGRGETAGGGKRVIKKTEGLA